LSALSQSLFHSGGHHHEALLHGLLDSLCARAKILHDFLHLSPLLLFASFLRSLPRFCRAGSSFFLQFRTHLTAELLITIFSSAPLAPTFSSYTALYIHGWLLTKRFVSFTVCKAGASWRRFIEIGNFFIGFSGLGNLHWGVIFRVNIDTGTIFIGILDTGNSASRTAATTRSPSGCRATALLATTWSPSGG